VGIGRGDLPGDPAGWIKVVADRETGEILGVHAFGPGSAACGPRILDLMAGGSAAALPDAEAGSGPSGVLDRAATAARRGDGS
jgi:hypothetical protein